MTPLFIGNPSLQWPVSQTCTAAQFAEDDFLRWMEEIRQQPRLHRKQWEYAYTLRVMELCGALQPGRTALGIGCGNEPVAAVLAGRGLYVTVSERPGFRPGGEERELASVMDLFYGGICSEEAFQLQSTWRTLDARELPLDLGGFDLVWACSVLEELGSIEAGVDAVVKLGRLLRGGGVGVFTTQFNSASDVDTLDTPQLAVWRRLDLLNLQARLADAGCEMLPLNLSPGRLPEDAIVDEPPYQNPVHLKMRLDGQVITSVGFAIRKL
jgi:hypothetical protein